MSKKWTTEILKWDREKLDYVPFLKQLSERFDFIDAGLELEVNRISIYEHLRLTTVWVTEKESQ